MDEVDFKAEMDRLDLAYNQDTNGGRRFIYYQRLRGNSPTVFSEAITRAIDTEKYYPVVATLHGLCDRVAREYALYASQQEAENPTPRLRPGMHIPRCGTCCDLGYVRIETIASGTPSYIAECPAPHCTARVRGVDLERAQREHSAFMYLRERERASWPVHPDNERRARFGGMYTSEPPPENFVMAHPDIPETPVERTKRMIAENVARMRMQNERSQTRKNASETR